MTTRPYRRATGGEPGGSSGSTHSPAGSSDTVRPTPPVENRDARPGLLVRNSVI